MPETLIVLRESNDKKAPFPDTRWLYCFPTMILISGQDQFPEIMIENVCSNTSPTIGNPYNISKPQFLYLSNVDISNIYSHLFQDFAVTYK